MIDLLTFAKIDDRAQEQSVKFLPDSPSDNSSERAPNTLDLLVPWDIPLECRLSEPVKQQIEESLRSLHQALTTPNLSQAHLQINQILVNFPTPDTQLAQIKTTRTALSTAAVKDYDTYFHINHVQTQTPEDTSLCLTQALLTNCHKFTSLCCATPNLSSQHISQQKQGFISYILLLTRVFNITDLSL